MSDERQVSEDEAEFFALAERLYETADSLDGNGSKKR